MHTRLHSLVSLFLVQANKRKDATSPLPSSRGHGLPARVFCHIHSVPRARIPHLHSPGQETANTLAGTPNGPAVSFPTEKVESSVHFVASSV